jgi:hypothetical protein
MFGIDHIVVFQWDKNARNTKYRSAFIVDPVIRRIPVMLSRQENGFTGREV